MSIQSIVASAWRPVAAARVPKPSDSRREAPAQPCAQQSDGTSAITTASAASRRRLLLSAAGAAAAAAGLARPPPAAAAGTALTPYQRGLALQYGLTADGRMRSCETDANPNCVSTASGANEAYMQPWEAPQGAPADAMLDFEAALRAEEPEARLVEARSLPSGEYRRWAVPDPLFDHDEIEVLIATQQPPYEAEPPLVTFRSQAAQVKYIWPIQQAVTDFGAQRQRLKRVRARLGWRILGCDLIECYTE